MPRKGGSKNDVVNAESTAAEACEGEELNEYEQLRAARIADNHARMEAVLQASRAL